MIVLAGVVLGALAAAALAVAAGVLRRIAAVENRMHAAETAPRPKAQADHELWAMVKGHAEILDSLQDGHRRITLAVAEGIERVERSERRIKQSVRRAREELAEQGYESPRLEAEAVELLGENGQGGPGDGMQPLSGDLDQAWIPPEGVPGSWTDEDRAAIQRTLMGG